MKKLIFFSVLILAFALHSEVKGQSFDPMWEICFRDVLFESGDEETRSLLPTVSAWMEDGTIQIQFNKKVGNVTVSVLDENSNILSVIFCSGRRGSMESMSPPSEAGNYTLKIEGPSYIGEGEFVIQ